METDALCFSFRGVEQKFEQVTDKVKDIFTTFSQELRYILCDIGLLTYEHKGMIISVDPLNNANAVPDEYEGKCYHRIKLADGSSFQLIFPNVYFALIRNKIEPGRLIKIIYTQPENKIVNIYPLPYYRNTTWSEFLENDEIDAETKIRLRYLEDDLTRIDFLEKNLYC